MSSDTPASSAQTSQLVPGTGQIVNGNHHYLNPFGLALRGIMGRRNLTGILLAEQVGITASSISRIINGATRPRQGTLTRIIKACDCTPEEQQALLRGYGGLPDVVAEEPARPGPSGFLPPDEMERIARYLEMKAMSIDFKKAVARTLTEAGIVFEQDVISGSVVADFVVEKPVRTAIECKFNVNRDWERTIGTAKLLREQLPCEQVMVVVPYASASASVAELAAGVKFLSVESLSELVGALVNRTAGGAA